MACFPVYGVPACRVGYRGHTDVCIHLADILLTALQLFMQLKTRRKSARFRVGEPAPYPGHYNRAFAFPSSSARTAYSVPYGSPACKAAIRVYQVPLNIQRVRAGSVSSPGSLRPCAPCARGSNRTPYLWFRPVSIFGLLPITVFINSSHVLTLLTSLALLPHDACSKVKPLTGLYPG